MNSIFSLPEATTHAGTVDQIFYGLLVLSGLTMLVVFGLIMILAIRYRRGSAAKRGPLPEIVSREFEIGWTAATLFLFAFLFWWAASADLGSLAAPAGALEIHVVAKQWMWKTQHPNGAREINALHVPVDKPVRLVMTSQDVIHSFFVPAFRVKQDVLPGRDTEIWFQATKTGVFPLLCAEYCGTDHSMMRGRIIVMRQEDYAKWLTKQPEGDDLAHEGAKLFVSQGCSGLSRRSVQGPCAHASPASTAEWCSFPTAARSRQTKPTSAIPSCSPNATSSPAMKPIMPSYAGLLDDGEIQSLTAYIRSLASDGEAK